MQSRQKKLVFHASAVETQAGAVAFLAPSGRGKSTLAASFATAGQRFLTDDGLVLEPGEACFVAQPSHPSLRLWKDSRLTLLSDAAELASPVSYNSKARLLASLILPHCAEPRPLAAAFFLGDGSATDILIHKLRGSAAVSAWVGHSFLLGIEDPSDLSIHFEKVTTVAEVVPSFHLKKRSYDDLVRLRRTIIVSIKFGPARMIWGSAFVIPSHGVARRVGDETVTLDLEAGAYFALDPVGARIWQLLEDGRRWRGSAASCPRT